MSSRSALPSGNDRSTDHVSAMIAYSPHLTVHAKIYLFLTNITSFRISICFMCTVDGLPVYALLLKGAVGRMGWLISRAGPLKMGYPWVSIQRKSWWKANSPEWVHPHTITFSGYAQKAHTSRQLLSDHRCEDSDVTHSLLLVHSPWVADGNWMDWTKKDIWNTYTRIVPLTAPKCKRITTYNDLQSTAA